MNLAALTLLFVTILNAHFFVQTSSAEEAYFVRYERKDFILYKLLPRNFMQHAQIVENFPSQKNTHFQKVLLDKEAVRNTLLRYHVIPRDEWIFLNHVNSIENTGWLMLENGNKLKWILKSSGVGQLIYPDGGAVHLAASPSKRYKEYDNYEYLHTAR